jgi:hypothetical protein
MLADTATFETQGRSLPWLHRHGPTILCAATGFLSAFTIAIGGLMPVGELILLAVFPWVLVRGFFARGWPVRLQQLGWFKLLLLLAGMTALGYVASDLYRATAFDNLVRGWARVAFLIIDLVAIAYLIDQSWARLRLFVLMLCLGATASALISGPLYGEWWKFGFGYTVTAFTFFLLAGRSLPLQVIIAIALGLLNLALGARSLGATCLLTAGLLALNQARGIWRPMAFLASIGVTVGLLVVANILFVEQQDHSGSNIERQSMIEGAAEAFVSSPLVGQGSWFTATEMISRIEEKRQALESTFRGYTAEEARKLSIHSQLLVSLAEGGILGGAFFLGLGALVLKTLRSLTVSSVPYRAFLFYIVLTGAWNLLMSPFSGVARVEIALLVCTGLLVILQRQGELPEDERE